MTRFLKLSSLILVLFATSCASPYKNLQKESIGNSAMRFQPKFKRELYRCVVDGKVFFKKFHLSGVLLFKEMEDSSTRVVFQNEMGISFFDFSWDKSDNFKVNSIMEELNRPAVVKTLQKDLGLFLMKGLDKSSEQHFSLEDDHYHRFTLEKGFAYYIEKSARLMRIENAGDSKKVTTITLEGKEKNSSMPEKVVFEHHKANFSIQLTKIVANVNE